MISRFRKNRLPVSVCILSPLLSGIVCTAIASAIFDLIAGYGIRGGNGLMNGAIVGVLATVVMTPALFLAGIDGLKVAFAIWGGLLLVHALLLFSVGHRFSFWVNFSTEMVVAVPAVLVAMSVWLVARAALKMQDRFGGQRV